MADPLKKYKGDSMDIAVSNTFKLYRASMELRKAMIDLEGQKLAPVSFFVLQTLTHNDRALSQYDLSKALVIPTSKINKAVHDLISRGYAVISDTVGSRNKQLISVTSKGKLVIAKYMKNVSMVINDAGRLSGLNESEALELETNYSEALQMIYIYIRNL